MHRFAELVPETPGDARVAPVRSLLRGSALACDDSYGPGLSERGSAEYGPERHTRHERPERRGR